VRLRSVFANVLANLELAQLLNDPGTDEQRDQQRSKRGEGGAKSEIAEDPERGERTKKLFVEQPVKQWPPEPEWARFRLIYRPRAPGLWKQTLMFAANWRFNSS